MSSSKLLQDDEGRRAQRLAWRYLRFGIRCREELRTYLNTKQCSDAGITAVLQRATDEGRLDDRACAKLWATTWAERGYAWETIQQRLQTKGLPPALIEHVLAPLRAHEDDESRARLALHRRLRSRPRHRDPRLRGRLARFLARRGFDSDLIDRVLADFLDLIST